MKLDIVVWNCNKKDTEAADPESCDLAVKEVSEWIFNNVRGAYVLANDHIPTTKQEFLLKYCKDCKPISASAGQEAIVCHFGNPSRGPCSMKRYDREELRKIEDSQDQDIEDHGLYSRMDVAVIQPAPDSAKLMIIGWHGHQTSKGVTLNVKLEEFDALITYAEVIRKITECKAIIIGGDFNLTSAQVKGRPSVSSVRASVVDGYKLPEGRKRLVDYAIMWPNDTITESAKPVVLNERIQEKLREQSGEAKTHDLVLNACFNHPIVHVSVEFHTAGPAFDLSSAARAGEGVKARSATPNQDEAAAIKGSTPRPTPTTTTPIAESRTKAHSSPPELICGSSVTANYPDSLQSSSSLGDILPVRQSFETGSAASAFPVPGPTAQCPGAEEHTSANSQIAPRTVVPTSEAIVNADVHPSNTPGTAATYQTSPTTTPIPESRTKAHSSPPEPICGSSVTANYPDSLQSSSSLGDILPVRQSYETGSAAPAFPEPGPTAQCPGAEEHKSANSQIAPRTVVPTSEAIVNADVHPSNTPGTAATHQTSPTTISEAANLPDGESPRMNAPTSKAATSKTKYAKAPEVHK